MHKEIEITTRSSGGDFGVHCPVYEAIIEKTDGWQIMCKQYFFLLESLHLDMLYFFVQVHLLLHIICTY